MRVIDLFSGIGGLGFGFRQAGFDIAAAVCILACKCSVPVLDTNIARVLSRAVLGKEPPKRYMYDKTLWDLSSMVRWRKEPLLAVVDFAAQVCTSRKPRCEECPIRGHCAYFSNVKNK